MHVNGREHVDATDVDEIATIRRQRVQAVSMDIHPIRSTPT